jgi:hypothetical protein
MEPRVNITYTVELGELEDETQRLVSRAIVKLKNITDRSEESFFRSDILSLNSADQVAALRRELATVDFMLEDISRIINGYLQYKSAPPEAPGPTAPTAGPPTIPEELQQKLQEFADAASTS